VSARRTPRKPAKRSAAGAGRGAAERLPSTEEVNPVSVGIDALPAREVVALIHEEDLAAWKAIDGALDALAALVEAVVAAFRRGGRLIYVGAGTSGRLGVLDSAECPPTFGVPPDLVQGIIAGGDRALRRAVEGAEDALEDGAQAIARAGVGRRDVVCGIAASGSTPFVRGALLEARRRGATTALVTSNVHLAEEDVASFAGHRITLAVGPEVIAGSTRMKSGTATKMALNILTTAAMVRWGKVHDNLMVDLVPANAKLRRRAVALVARLAQVDAPRARELLDLAGGRVKVAVVMGRRGLSAEAAERELARADDFLRRALGEAT
jgi:N-acetylmuramic acid 6-phosphate etherase